MSILVGLDPPAKAAGNPPVMSFFSPLLDCGQIINPIDCAVKCRDQSETLQRCYTVMAVNSFKWEYNSIQCKTPASTTSQLYVCTYIYIYIYTNKLNDISMFNCTILQ